VFLLKVQSNGSGFSVRGMGDEISTGEDERSGESHKSGVTDVSLSESQSDRCGVDTLAFLLAMQRAKSSEERRDELREQVVVKMSRISSCACFTSVIGLALNRSVFLLTSLAVDKSSERRVSNLTWLKTGLSERCFGPLNFGSGARMTLASAT